MIPSNAEPATRVARIFVRLIIAPVPRRLHTPKLFVGDVPLDATQARHAREVLRLEEGAQVEVFDDEGAVAAGILRFVGPRDAVVRVEQILPAAVSGTRIVVAAAVPKGERADWMVEKLSELGVHAFIPLAAQRSVVLPEGKGKRDRWTRIATESAKQSRRAGVMRIEDLSSVSNVLETHPRAIALSTGAAAAPLAHLVHARHADPELTLLIGPEGGWTPLEIETFTASGVAQAQLTQTILRVETAAITAAAVAAVLLSSKQ